MRLLSDRIKPKVRTKPRRKYKYRIFILLTLLSIVPLAVLGTFSYTTYTREMTDRVDLSLQSTMEQVQSQVENTLTSIRQYYSEISSREAIKWAMEETSVPYPAFDKVEDAQEVLRGALYLDEYVKGYTFINLKGGWALSNYGMYPLDQVTNREVLDEFLNQEALTPNRIYWSNHLGETLDSPLPGRKMDFTGLLLVLKLPTLTAQTDSLIVVNLNDNLFPGILQKNLAEYEMCILDMDGKPVAGTSEDLMEYASSVLSQGGTLEAQGNVKLDNGRTLHIITNRGGGQSSPNGLTYVAAYDLENVQEGADRIRAAALAIIAVLILFLVLCLISANVIYRPISNLTEYARGIFGYESESEDEFDYLFRGVGELSDKKKLLEELVKDQGTLLIELFMVRLMRGGISQTRIDQFLERYKLQKCKHYMLMAVHIIMDSESFPTGEVESEAVSLTVAENLPGEIKDELFVPPISQGDLILLLVGMDDKKALEERVDRIHSMVTSYVEATYHCPIAVGVSQTFHLLKHLRTAFNECREALMNDNVSADNAGSRNGSIAYYEDFASDDNVRHGYDLTLEQAVRVAVDNGDQHAASEAVDQFVDGLGAKSITRYERSFYIYRFMIAVMMVPSNAGLSMNQVFSSQSVDVFLQLNTLYDSEQLKCYYKKNVVLPAITSLAKFRHGHSNDILDKVQSLVKESKGDITLAECAQQLNYHPSYIWKVLKTERNMTFTELANYEKMEAAKDLLINTELSVNEIASRLNYSNTQNFIRFFSKYEQMSPGKYRKEKKTG